MDKTEKVKEKLTDKPKDSASDAEWMIEIEDLVKRYGDKYAVDGISFKVGRGEVVGFLGPNGAGKSTTINVITGYLSSTSGTVRVAGKDILEEPGAAKRLIGYLPEQPPLYPDMTVDEYLGFTYELKGCTYNRKKHLDEVCTVTKIADVRGRLIKNLSKGYRQRVGIAQALVGNPPLIILDEPTVGLDPKQIIEVRSLIRALGENHTVLLSTHILSEVETVCDRIVIINKGKIIADEKKEDIVRIAQDGMTYVAKICGPVREVTALLRSRQGVSRVERQSDRDGDANIYLIKSDPGIDIRKSLFFALAQNNWPLVGLEPQGENLEEVFIKLVDRSDVKKKGAKRQSLVDTSDLDSRSGE